MDSLEHFIMHKIRGLYLYRRLKAIRYRLTYERSDNKMSDAMKRFRAASDKKPRGRMRAEIDLCRKYWKCFPFHYFRYELYRNDRELSEKELLDYIPEFFFYNLFLPFHDTGEYTTLVRDKNVTEQFFRSVGISQPVTISKIIDGRFYSAGFEPITYRELEREIHNQGCKKVVVKPAYGHGGFGIFFFCRDDSGKYVSNHSQILDEMFLNHISLSNNYIVQAGIEQDEETARIYSNSINTFRIATENTKGSVRIICSTLRVGRGGSFVDNSSQGGLVVKINADSGEFGEIAVTEWCDSFSEHPDSHFVFKNQRISKWGLIKDFVLESARKLPYFTYLGWDIALSVNGPLAIETNVFFGLDHYQVSLGGVREKFNILDPDYYWKNRRKHGG